MLEKKKLPDFASLKQVHIVGVCGTLMGNFAVFLKRRGIRVTGSDQNIYPPMSDVLKNAGVEILNGYRAENLSASGSRPDLIVIGNVIRRDNPEAQEAIEGGYAYSSLPEAMEHLLLGKTRNIVVAGTHGKTTTSSLLAFTLLHSKKDPSYFIGGVCPDLPHSFHVSGTKEGIPFVLEGDEYDTAFWDKVPKFNHYLPNDVILTSVEYDHADIYPDFPAVVRAFEGLMARIRPQGRIIACYDSTVVRELAEKSSAKIESYGSPGNKEAQWTPANIQNKDGITSFDILDQGKKVESVSLNLPGQHNVLNALSVWIECKGLGLTSNQIKEAFALFRGIKRRQEVCAEVRGVLVIDDFAHHPTAVRETLKALKSKYPGRRLLSVFEPRSATSRRKVFQKDYGTAFQEADLIFIANPFDQSRIALEDQFSSQMLVDDLVHSGKQAFLFAAVEEGIHQVIQQAKPGDVVAVLSNGGFGGFIPKLIENLRRESSQAPELGLG